MGVKKLHTVFLQYVSFLALAILLVIGVNLGGYIICVNNDFILPLNQKSAAVENAKGTLQSAAAVAQEDIPSFCEYVLFTDEGQYVDVSIPQHESVSIWENCVENKQATGKSHLYTVIERENEVLVLRYSTAAQFSSQTLHRVFPSADLVLIAVVVLEILCLLMVISFLFGKYLGKRMEKLLVAAHKIEQQDLDFAADKTKIAEIDRVLDAFDHMKLALKESLAKQWQDDKMRQDQLAALAHDLKTPLTIIRGNTELLLDLPLSDEQKECADYIETSAVQMQNYVQALIEVTKSWESTRLNLQKVDVSSLLQETKNQISGLCAVNNITLHWNCQQYPAVVSADHDFLMRALMNVLSNAVEHTPQGGEITLEVSRREKMLSFVITDTGKGFSAEALKHGTEQFFMEDESRNSKSHYGIGLYVAASVAQKHGGQLILENSQATGGAKVTLEISVYSNPINYCT